MSCVSVRMAVIPPLLYTWDGWFALAMVPLFHVTALPWPRDRFPPDPTSTGGHDGEWRVAPAGAVAGSMAFAPQGAMTANAWQAPSGAYSWKVPASVSLRAYRRGWPWSLISRSGCSGLLLASVRPLAAAPAFSLLAFSWGGVPLRRQARWCWVWLSHDGGSGPGATVFVIMTAHPGRSRPMGRVPPA